MPTNSIKLLAPDVHRGLAELVAKRLGLQLTSSKLKRDPTGEVSFSIGESVRDQDIFIITQIGSGVVNDRVLELLIMINASKTASQEESLLLFQISHMQDKIERISLVLLLPLN